MDSPTRVGLETSVIGELRRRHVSGENLDGLEVDWCGRYFEFYDGPRESDGYQLEFRIGPTATVLVNVGMARCYRLYRSMCTLSPSEYREYLEPEWQVLACDNHCRVPFQDTVRYATAALRVYF
jgi:hypothetical protein